MAEEISVSWSPENIPDEDLLFMRVHRMWLNPDRTIKPGAFQNRPTSQDGMSTDWAKYASADETRNRGKIPSKNGVIQMVVGKVRQVPNQRVVHTPDLTAGNRAHTDVFGEKHTEVRLKLSRLSDLVIPLDP